MKNKINLKDLTFSAVEFRRLNDSRELANLLRYEFYAFRSVIESASYQQFSVQKAKGGERIIEAPNESLSRLQKKLNHYLQAYYYKVKPAPVQGFIQAVKDEPQHTILSNAGNHVGKNFVLNIDLKDFFHSISADQVRSFFLGERFGFPEDLATCIALICCWTSRLPMGAATSPVVSNLLCLDLDQALIDIAKTYDLVYTRYADDLTFSSDHTIYPDEIEAIKNIIYLSGFRVNEKKFRLQSKHGRQSVTGIKVNQKLNVDRRYIRKIRALIHDAHLNGIANAASKHFGARSSNDRLTKHFWLRLEGKINFVGQVRGKDDMVYNKLKQGFYSLGMNAHAEGLI